MRRILRIAAILTVTMAIGCGGGDDTPPPKAAGPTPTPVATPAAKKITISGQVQLGEAPGPHRVARVELHGNDLRERLIPIVKAIGTLEDSLNTDRRELLELRNQLSIGRQVAAEKIEGSKRLAELTEKARPDFEAARRLEAAISSLNEIRRDFIATGPNYMPVQDPLSKEVFTLNAHDGQRAASLDQLDTRIMRYQKQCDAHRKIVDLHKEEADRITARAAEIDLILKDLNLEERRNIFIRRIKALRLNYGQIADSLEIVERTRSNSQPVTMTLSDAEGDFEVEAPPAPYVLYLEQKGTQGENSGDGEALRRLWIMNVEGESVAAFVFTFDTSNVLADYSTTLMDRMRTRSGADEEFARQLGDYVESYPDKPDSDISRLIDMMLR